MEGEKKDRIFGQIALKKGFITEDRIDKALRIQIKEDISKGEHRPIGRIMLNEGMITLQQVGYVLKTMNKLYERETDKGFGEIALEMGFITQEQLDNALDKQTLEVCSNQKRRPIGRILLNEGHMDLRQIHMTFV